MESKTIIRPPITKLEKENRGSRFTPKAFAVDSAGRMHKPTTDIIEKVRAASPDRGLLLDVKITPAIAQDLLVLNDENRPLSHDVVDRYAKIMEDDRWEYTGETVKVSKKMKLIDGQHKLKAIVKSGKTIVMHIQTGLDPDAFAILDTGRKRTGGDVLAIAGEKDFNYLAAAIKAEIYLRKHGRTGGTIHHTKVTNQDVLEWTKTENIQLMRDCLTHAHNTLHKKGKFLSTSNWATIYYTFSRRHRGDATEFVNLLASGENISSTKNPSIYLLREKLLAFQQGKFEGLRKYRDVKTRFIIAAWNHFRAKEKPKKLVVDQYSNTMDKPM